MPVRFSVRPLAALRLTVRVLLRTAAHVVVCTGMANENMAALWGLRILGFILMWLGLALFFQVRC
jgi:hypothetical protein